MNKIKSEIMTKVKKSFELTQMKKYCITNYTSAVKNFLNFNEGTIETVESLNLNMVKEFLLHMLNTRKLKIGTVNNYRSALKYLFEVVLDKQWCDKQIPYLKGYKTLPTVLSKSSVMELVNATENIMYQTLFLTVFASGIRIGEALNLRFSDIDSTRMQITIRESKNGSSRKAILGKKNLEELRVYYKNWYLKRFGKFEKEDYLFCYTKKNIKVSYTSTLKAFSKAAKNAGLPSKATIHSIRHGFGTYLLEKGAPIGTIKELLGHNSLRSTLLYTKLANYSAMGVKSPLDYDDELDTKHALDTEDDADTKHEIDTNNECKKEIDD